ncbi:MAG: hypothetical protein ABEI99_04825 [Halobaculum sp.]
MLDVGDPAPDFELRGFDDGEIETYRLQEFLDDDQWVLLTFYR